MAEKDKSNEIKITRIYDAPVKAVWEAWTDPDKTAKWWGPRGFTITTHSKDVKTGGHWNYTMRAPDGTEYPNKTVYLEVDEYKRMVYDHGGNDERAPLFRVTVFFKEQRNKTVMEMSMALPTPEAAEQTRKFIIKAGGNSTWDRLAEYLEKENSQKDVFVINRSFDAPIETVFEMWHDPKHFGQWLGPADTSMEFFQSDVGVGKTTFYKMNYGNGSVMFGKMTYQKINSPNYIEYTQIFCDEQGNLSKHPNVPVWPDTMLTKIYLAKEGEDQTRVTVMWQPHGEISKEELAAFIEMRAGMTQGWTQSFDKLDAHLGKGQTLQ